MYSLQFLIVRTVKVRLQSAAAVGRYRSTFHALYTIFREERMSGLYRGIASPLITAAPLNGLIFSSYGFLTKIQLDNGAAVPTLTQVSLAGAGSGIIASIITTPTELIKTRQQILQSASSSAASSTGARDVAIQIVKQHGLRGLYRGFTATVWRDAGFGTYFAVYEMTIRYWPRSSQMQNGETPQKPPWLATLTAGGLAGVTSWIMTFPFDVVKTRMQAAYSVSPDNPYRNTLSTIVSSYRAEGLPVFFRGLAPTLIRSIPVNMVTFTTFEAIVHGFS